MKSLLRPKAVICALAVSVAAAGLGVSVATGLSTTQAPSVPIHAAVEGQYRIVRATATTAAVKQAVKFAYVYGTATVQPGQFFIGDLKCPSKFSHPISGGLDSDSNGTFLVTSRPAPAGVGAKAAHRWAIGATNTDTKRHDVLAVVVCAQ